MTGAIGSHQTAAVARIGTRLAAFTLAAAVAAFAGGVMLLTWEAISFAFYIALAHALFIGMPLYAVFRRAGRVNALSCIAGGATAAVVPAGIIGLVLLVQLPAGPLAYGTLLLMLAPFGAVGGATFWLTCTWAGLGFAEPVRDDLPTRYPHKLAVVALAAAASGIALALPEITKDRTCHNMFRDGRTSVSPVLSIDLNAPHGDWPKLAAVMEQVGRRHQLSFRDASLSRPGAVEMLDLSACNDVGLNIEVHRQVLAGVADPPAFRGISIGVYLLNAHPRWEPVARDLVATLELEWPGMLRFRGPQGQVIPAPQQVR